MGIPLSVPYPVSWTASGAIKKYDACVTNTEGTVIATDADNDTGFVGFAQHAAADGEAVALSKEGDITKARVYGSGVVSIQNYLSTSGTTGGTGEVQKSVSAASATQHIIAQALEAGTTDTQEIIVRQRSFYDYDQAST